MPRRELIATSSEQSLGQLIAEMAARIDELSRLNGLPPLRSRTVVSVGPNDTGGGN